MVDMNKRNALKVIGGTAVITAVPSLAVAKASLLGGQVDDYVSTDEQVLAVSANTELTITLSVDPVPTVKMINHSDKAIVVRHVYPGIVHAGDKTFDMNSIFSEGAFEMGAGASRSFKINPTYSTQSEIAFPRHQYRNKPQRVVAVRGSDRFGEIVNSSRSFYS